MWQQITEITTPTSGSAEAQVAVPADSPWFDGHFPGMPLLPGIAQLAMVERVIRQVWGEGLRACRYSRVRFKLKIDPGSPIRIKVSRHLEKTDVFNFQIGTSDGIACVGNVQTASAAA